MPSKVKFFILVNKLGCFISIFCFVKIYLITLYDTIKYCFCNYHLSMIKIFFKLNLILNTKIRYKLLLKLRTDYSEENSV